MDRVCIFFDGSNFYHALKEAGWPVQIDFGKLSIALAGQGRKHVHTYYYNAPLVAPSRDDPDFEAKDERCRSQQRFFNALRFVPNLTFRPGRLQRAPTGGYVEKGVDVMLATDMLILGHKDRYDVAVLISSDGDYRHAIEAVKFEFGKEVELHQVEASKAYSLIMACSRYCPISRKLIDSCRVRTRR
ncbi:MAG: NYN domain-containing protein [Planctomycetes bacterium]|nr:NYN domain-containing protein [Planctomycetota bacterium]